IVYCDLETKYSIDEVGGRNNIKKLGLAAAVTYNTAQSAYHHYTEERVKELIAELKSAELVVGYNLLDFDYEVLSNYSGEPFATLPTLDMMEYLARRLGFRPSLESVASATLGVSKSADGLQAIQWYRQGLIDKVLEYCQRDVEITKKLYEYGQLRKVVYYWDKQYQRRVVPVSW
ncbi:MAG: ribonuclease H-like domain-containing protein, partial [Candidatus Hadarchaeum sp.]